MSGKGLSDRAKVAVLLCCAQFMLTLDFAIVNVALPSMQRGLGFSGSSLQWVVGAYGLLFGGFLLLGGRAGDVLGRKRLFVWGLAVFTAASLAGGLATDPIVLILARGLQGLSAAAVSPAVLALMSSLFTSPPDRAKAMGAVGAVSSAGFAGGVLAGGVLTEWLGWRWVMFVNIPAGIILIALAARMLTADHRAARATHQDTDGGGERQRIDLPSALLVTSGTCSVIYALTASTDHGWTSAIVLSTLTAGIALIIAFLALQTRLSNPLVPLGIFTNRNVSAGNAIAFAAGGVMSVSTYFLTLYLQHTLHYSALRAGLAFFPQALAILLTSKFIAQSTGRSGPRPVLLTGVVFLAAGSLILTTVPHHPTDTTTAYLLHVLPGSVLLGLGLSTMMISTAFAAMAGVAPPQLGLASGLVNSNRQLGVAVLLAIAVSLTNPQNPDYQVAFGFTTTLAILIAALTLTLAPRTSAKTPTSPAQPERTPAPAR
ncbi:MFS transporter [Spirillospora sp. NPDC048911]|uniref:MFS transporter n=1 Tax=Spirillospora sp. NPDC048911 TaxID=3364527 RepID=UPI00371EAA38